MRGLRLLPIAPVLAFAASWAGGQEPPPSAAQPGPAKAPKADYVPAPEAADTGRLMVGAFLCSLWSNREWERLGVARDCWAPIRPYPEREPVLGWYDEASSEVADWEIKWLLEHGVSFVVPCWYRRKGNLGKPVEPALDHWLREGLFRSRYGERLKFAILWENANKIACGVESERDLLDNILPYWIENYFRRPNYLTFEGKPILFVYRADILSSELGGETPARAALGKARAACVRAGFKGLIVVGEHHTRMDAPVPAMKDLGLDYVASYHWPSFSSLMPREPTPDALIAAQERCWSELGAATGLPVLVTVSMGWDARPWGRSRTPWRLTPEQFQALCAKARTFVERRPGEGLDARMILIDNWNEFGEGHYIVPHREHGFGYLDAARAAFVRPPGAHVDLVPEDLGLGPYGPEAGR
jgi:hypothetical protein